MDELTRAFRDLVDASEASPAQWALWHLARLAELAGDPVARRELRAALMDDPARLAGVQAELDAVGELVAEAALTRRGHVADNIALARALDPGGPCPHPDAIRVTMEPDYPSAAEFLHYLRTGEDRRWQE